MEILVCVRRVPDTSENEIQLNSAGSDIERDDLVYAVNEPDNYAVEEALQIADRSGGNVTVVTVGGDDDEEVLRREMAMGAGRGVLISDEAFSGSDGKGIASSLKSFCAEGKIRPRPDWRASRGRRRAGGRHAGGHAGLPVRIRGEFDRSTRGRKLKIGREIEGGNREMSEIDLPVCSPFRPESMSHVTSGCEASGKWPPCRFRLSALRN